MNAMGLSDFRKIPDEVMNYLRRIAVRAVEENHYSPELIAKVLGVSRSCIYDWLRWYRRSCTHSGRATLCQLSGNGYQGNALVCFFTILSRQSIAY